LNRFAIAMGELGRFDAPAPGLSVDGNEIAEARESKNPPPGPPETKPRLYVSGNEITLDGKTYVIGPEQAAFVGELIKAGIRVPVSGPAMMDRNELTGPRPDRIYAKLPDEIRAVIKKKPGSGYWINLE
jgi:hypothetical protein